MDSIKIKVPVSGIDTEIELTEAQVKELFEKSKKPFDFRDIKTVEDAFSFLSIDYAEFLEKHKDLDPHALAYLQLVHIIKALNGGDWMDYSDTNVAKYYPWFNASGSASGFSYHDYGYGNSLSGVGSRLTCKSAEIAKYAGTQFIEIYNQYIN
ncbi:hypothetical protein [Emticicia fontis]